MSPACVPERDSAQNHPVVLRAGIPVKASGGASAAVEKPAASSSISDSITWERKMWQMDMADFPASFEEECRTAVDSGRAERLMQIWQERDLERFLAWGRTQPAGKMLPRPGGYILIHYRLISAAASKSPEFAWKLAKDLTPKGLPTEEKQWVVVGSLLQSDLEAARVFLRQHRDEIQTFGAGELRLSGVDPQKALPVVLEIPPGSGRKTLIAEMARDYGEKTDKIGEAKSWFQSLPAENREDLRKLVNAGGFFDSSISQTHIMHLREAWK